MIYGAHITKVDSEFEREMIYIWVYHRRDMLCTIEMNHDVIAYILDNYYHILTTEQLQMIADDAPPIKLDFETNIFDKPYPDLRIFPYYKTCISGDSNYLPAEINHDYIVNVDGVMKYDGVVTATMFIIAEA